MFTYRFFILIYFVICTAHGGLPPIHMASLHAEITGDQGELTNTLQEFKSTLEAKNPLGQTALYHAVMHYHPSIITTLLNHGAIVNTKDIIQQPILFAALDRWYRNKHVPKAAQQAISIISQLICADPTIVNSSNTHGMNPLAAATYLESFEAFILIAFYSLTISIKLPEQTPIKIKCHIENRVNLYLKNYHTICKLTNRLVNMQKKSTHDLAILSQKAKPYLESGSINALHRNLKKKIRLLLTSGMPLLQALYQDTQHIHTTPEYITHSIYLSYAESLMNKA